MERAELRDLVLFLLGFVYLVAFTSVFLQADGLFGVNGLEPVHKVAGRVSQERAGVLWWARPAGTGADEWLDMIAVAGIVASVLVTAGFAYIPLLALCWLLYLSILLVGQTFLSFQWDIFLLEVGGLALLYAPASPLSAKRKPSAVSIMCLRWCLFKIMLMSGVVKIQARCPAWMGLHALHYHYATQCIPTPLSWYAHQLPNFVQKLSVMGTLLFEIPGSFLIIAPWREARVCAACVNIFLMAVIALTGNYTFFNVLTATLCIPLLESAASSCAPPSCAPTTAGGSGDDRGRARKRERWCFVAIRWLAPVAFLLACALRLFTFSIRRAPDGAPAHGWCGEHEGGGGGGAFGWSAECGWNVLEYHLDVNVAFTEDQVTASIQMALQWVVPIFAFAMVAAAAREVADEGARAAEGVGALGRAAWGSANVILVAIAGLCYLLASLHPLAEVAPALAHSGMIPAIAAPMYQTARQWHLVSGYGLFRRMTGLGLQRQVLHNSGGKALPTVSARPELVIDASDDGRTRQ